MKKYLTIFLTLVLLFSGIRSEDNVYFDENGNQITEIDTSEHEEPFPETYSEEQFYKLYDSDDVSDEKHPEIVAAKRYFSTRESTISALRYKGLIQVFMDGTVHSQQIDPVIREEAMLQIREFAEEYVNTVHKDLEDFKLHNLYLDIVKGDYHRWMDRVHPDGDSNIEPDL